MYNVTEYVRDHPGGPDVLLDTAGTDATEAYDDVGHSEDADELLSTFLIGTVKGAQQGHAPARPKAVQVVQQQPSQPSESKSSKGLGSAPKAIGIAATSVGGVALSWYLFLSSDGNMNVHESISKAVPSWTLGSHLLQPVSGRSGGFGSGLAVASVFFSTIGGILASKLSKLTHIDAGFTRYPPFKPARKTVKRNPHLVKGFLEPKEYKALPLVQKDTLAPNVYRFVFQLPNPQDIIGLPIGQHVAIKANIDGKAVSRPYTPTSNNLDRGRLELVIKCYADGLLTGKYLADLQIGDCVEFRGPKGAMRYTKGLCRKIGMIAGGTGITPMYQLIRAICEDDTDTTEVSLIYANRTEDDILLRQELEAFATHYPRNLKIWYMLDHPPDNWAYGSGYVTPKVMRAKLPALSADTKVMLCGPPGMVNAAKKGLAGLGFQDPGAVAKMSDQVFCF